MPSWRSNDVRAVIPRDQPPCLRVARIVAGVGEQPLLKTFWFSDIEGSTRLVAEVGDRAFRELLREHRAIVRAAFVEYGGEEIGTEGDSFFATFPSPASAACAAQVVCSGLDGGPIRVRIGIHAGLSLVEEGDHVGLDVHRAARIAGVAHGGQIVLSDTARAHVADDVVDLGEHRLKDLLGSAAALSARRPELSAAAQSPSHQPAGAGDTVSRAQ